ncbi:LysR substrate-binding domain-containing protein [Bordetella genomosp. 13]|uniref:LysR family transcriptional regulator n=1 Tax=Bordetella genomosp. 13 TaxID=463040 RepID=A0A1W6ZBR9_9BORD|nr:LysR substrate-binding domain-containing protein [Bordetella genomosp. 13]ARP94767.1 LysR family transcriptional regulator [Bordetella genomosp. 13]
MAPFDLDQLRTFVAVADAGSLTAAAPRVFLSQSSVSEQIRKLEIHAGQSLLKRGKLGAVPTPAGQRLLAYARRILALSDQARREMHGLTLEAHLRLAFTDYFRPNEISGLLARLKQTYPGLRLHVSIAKSDAVREAHARGELDLAVAMRVRASTAAPDMGGDPALVLRREPLCWLAGRDAEPAPGEPLPLVALGESCSLRQYTESVLRQARVPYEVAHVASGVPGLQMALAAGLGVACLNAGAIGADIRNWPRADGLPPMGEAVFEVLPPPPGQDAHVAQVREAVVAHFTR